LAVFAAIRCRGGVYPRPSRGRLADQLRRASESIGLNIAEGVGRWGADRAKFYNYARASVLECGGACDYLLRRRGMTEGEWRQAKGLLARLNTMLVRLERCARAG